MDKSAKEPLQKRQRRNSTAEPSSLWSSAITLGLSNEQEVELSNVQEVELLNVQEVELSNEPQAESMGSGA